MTFDAPVRRPVATAMVFVALSILGVIAWRRAPVELIPPLTGDTISVAFSRPGSEPELVERELLAPLEARVSELPGVRETRSEIRGASGTLQVTLAKGVDVRTRELELRQIAADVARIQPRGTMIEVNTFDLSSLSPIVLWVQVTGGDDENVLRDLVEQRIAPRLISVSGVGQVQTGGGAPREARVELDPDRCAALGVRPEQVVRALSASVGRLRYVGGADGVGGRVAVVVDARPRGEASLADIAVDAARGVRLRHVAQVAVTAGRKDTLFRVNGQPSVGMVIFKEQSANLVRLGRDLRARLDQLRQEFRVYNLDFVVGFDAARVVEEQIDRLQGLALSGFVIAILVLVLFLRQPRAVLVVAISAPVSLLAALAFLFVAGQSINLITLFGLAVAIGMLVDNSIVVYEATQRMLERGAAPDRAASEAVRRTIRAIVAATITNIVVFLPLLFVDLGTSLLGELVRVLALAYTVPQVASLVVAAGLVPLLARRLTAPAALRRFETLRRRKEAFGGLNPPDRAKELFSGLLRVALRQPGVWIAGVAAAVLLTAFVAVGYLIHEVTGTPAAPEADQVQMQIQAPGSASLERTAAAFARLERVARDQLGVESVESVIQESGGWLTIHLTPREKRSADVTAGGIRAAVRRAARDLEGMQVDAPTMGQESGGGGAQGGDITGLLGQGPAEVVLSGPDAGQLNQLAGDVRAQLDAVPEVGETAVSTRSGAEEIQVRPSPESLAAYGLTGDQVLPALGVVRREGVVLQTGVTLADGREVPLTVRRRGGPKITRTELARLRLNTPAAVLPLETVASLHRMPPAPTIQRHNGRREVQVTYRLGQQAPQSGPARKALDDRIQSAIRATPRPPGYTLEIKTDESTTDWFRKVAIAAVLLLFAVLAVTFESLTMPVLILAALPLTLVGVVWALIATGISPLDRMALIGVVALIGVTVNPAILLVDRMQHRASHGAKPGAAALAAVRERARPVLMTTATAVAGLWPLALQSGRENEIWPPFATVVMGGLCASTVLTLLVIPVGFVLLRRLDVLFGRVGPWVVAGWLAATIAVMAPLVAFGLVTSLGWQLIVALLVGGILLGGAVFFFRPAAPPAPAMTDGAPPILEVRFLHKIYGESGPIRYAWRLPDIFARRVLEKGGRPFDPRRALERLAPEALLLAGASYLAVAASRTGWRVVFAMVAGFLGRAVLLDLRRARGQADALGRVNPGGAEGVLAAAAPWVAWAWVTSRVYLQPLLAGEERPRSAGEWVLFLFFPLLLGAIVATWQLGRRTALRIARGEIPDWVTEGALRRPRTTWRRFSRRVCGLDLPVREVRALINAEFRVEQGMVGVLGPNGAGKTTLLRQVAGILTPSCGTITFGGVPISRIRRRLAHWVGYLPQEFGLPGDLSAREYLEFYALLYEIRPESLRRERIERLLDEVGLKDRADDPIRSYSGGMRQRVAVARTLLRLPAVIVVDEPTVGLDPRERIRFRNLLARLAEGRIVLFSTHVVEDVAVSCARVIVFAEGRTVYDGPPERLAHVAQGRVWSVRLAPGESPAWPAGTQVVDQAPAPDGAVRCRVLCDAAPHPSAELSDPTLEDGYLLLVREERRAASERVA